MTSLLTYGRTLLVLKSLDWKGYKCARSTKSPLISTLFKKRWLGLTPSPHCGKFPHFFMASLSRGYSRGGAAGCWRSARCRSLVSRVCPGTARERPRPELESVSRLRWPHWHGVSTALQDWLPSSASGAVHLPPVSHHASTGIYRSRSIGDTLSEMTAEILQQVIQC